MAWYGMKKLVEPLLHEPWKEPIKAVPYVYRRLTNLSDQNQGVYSKRRNARGWMNLFPGMCVSLTENLTSKCKASTEHCAFTLHPTNVGNWMNVQQAQPASSLAFGSQALPPWRGASVAACKHLIRNPKTSKHSGFMVHHYSSCTTRTQRPLIGYAAQRESSRTHHYQPNQTRNISMFVLAHRTSIV